MSVKTSAADMSYVELCGGTEEALRAAYLEGAAAQRIAWAKWFDSLPKGLRDAIQRHKKGAQIQNTWHEDGSLTLKIKAAPIN